MTRGERVIAFIENFCCVPEGDLVGRPMQLRPFQKKWILAVYDNPHGTRLAILSIGKKNGKTPLIAALVLCHVAGPEARQNSQIFSGAMSQDQAAAVFKYARKMVLFSPKLSALIRVQPSMKQLVGLTMGVEYKAISRKKTTAHGRAPVLAILDELGQVRGELDEFVDAITNAMGAYDDAMLFVISTQAASDRDMLSIWIDDFKEHGDPHTVCHVYSAENPDCDIEDESAWREANPALGIFRSEKDVRDLAVRAKRMPSKEASFRNLILNQRVETISPLISRGVWIANSFEPDPRAFKLAPVYAGLDLSARSDLTALIMTSFFEDRWHVKCRFWTPEEGIHERSKNDRQPYPLWAKQGLLRTLPGSSIDYDQIAEEMRDLFADVPDLRALAYDRWRMDVMEKSLERAKLVIPLAAFGQGFKDMSPAIDELESILLNGDMAHGNHPVLTMCAQNAIAIKDEAGNRKLDKKRATGRIDGISGLTMALGIAAALKRGDPAYQLFFA